MQLRFFEVGIHDAVRVARNAAHSGSLTHDQPTQPDRRGKPPKSPDVAASRADARHLGLRPNDCRRDQLIQLVEVANERATAASLRSMRRPRSLGRGAGGVHRLRRESLLRTHVSEVRRVLGEAHRDRCRTRLPVSPRGKDRRALDEADEGRGAARFGRPGGSHGGDGLSCARSSTRLSLRSGECSSSRASRACRSTCR